MVTRRPAAIHALELDSRGDAPGEGVTRFLGAVLVELADAFDHGAEVERLESVAFALVGLARGDIEQRFERADEPADFVAPFEQALGRLGWRIGRQAFTSRPSDASSVFGFVPRSGRRVAMASRRLPSGIA